jgi:hypothetical protein
MQHTNQFNSCISSCSSAWLQTGVFAEINYILEKKEEYENSVVSL